MKRRKGLMLLALTLLLLFMTGCWDRHELEEISFITAVGIDLAPGNKTDITLQSSVPTGEAEDAGGVGGKGRRSGSDETITYTLEGPLTAQHLGNTMVSRNLSFVHMQVLVVSEEYARKRNVLTMIASAVREQSFRRDMLMVVSQGRADEYIRRNKPIFEKFPHKYFELIYPLWKETGLWPNIHLHSYLRSIDAGKGLSIAILGSSQDPSVSKSKREDTYHNQPKYRRQLPGKTGDSLFKEERQQDNFLYGKEFRKQGGNPVNMMGSALFRKGRMIGKLGATDTQLMLLIQGEVMRFFRIFADPLKPNQPEGIGIQFSGAGKPKIEMEWDGNQLKSIHETIPLDGRLETNQGQTNYVTNQRNIQILTDHMDRSLSAQANDLAKEFQTEFKGDPFYFDWEARKHFRYDKEWQNFNWSEAFCRAKIRIDVKTTIRFTGKQLEEPGSQHAVNR